MKRALAAFFYMVTIVGAQTWQGNHDETKVKPYSLPDPLTTAGGKKITSAGEWQKTRRPEIFRMFETEMYGRTPSERVKTKFDVVSVEKNALDGKAVRKQAKISFPGRQNSPVINVLIYLPA